MKDKMFAILAACMMLAVAGMAIVQSSQDNDAAAGPAGNMNVYVYTSSESWNLYDVAAYNAASAIMATTLWNSNPGVIDTTYKYSYIYGGETYYDINSAYGTITTFNGQTNDTSTGNVWNMLVFTKTGSETSFSWKLGNVATGWYKPFEDYAGIVPAYGTANIALYYGSASNYSDMITSLENEIANDSDKSTVGLTAISTASGSVFEHKFYLKIGASATPAIASGTVVKKADYSTVALNTFMLKNGITVLGYGSDAVLALIDAIGASNVSFTASSNPVPGYLAYGWMESMLGLGTSYVGGQYIYWQSYTSYEALGDSSAHSADVGTGAYSALTNAPLIDDSIAFVYQAYQ